MSDCEIIFCILWLMLIVNKRSPPNLSKFSPKMIGKLHCNGEEMRARYEIKYSFKKQLSILKP